MRKSNHLKTGRSPLISCNYKIKNSRYRIEHKTIRNLQWGCGDSLNSYKTWAPSRSYLTLYPLLFARSRVISCKFSALNDVSKTYNLTLIPSAWDRREWHVSGWRTTSICTRVQSESLWKLALARKTYRKLLWGRRLKSPRNLIRRQKTYDCLDGRDHKT